MAFVARTSEELEKITSEEYINLLVSTGDKLERIKQLINEKDWPRVIAFLEDELSIYLNKGDVPENLLRNIKESRRRLIGELKSLGFQSLSQRLPVR